MGVPSGTAKWMVNKGKSQSEMDDDWGYPYDLGTPHISLVSIFKSTGLFPVPTPHRRTPTCACLEESERDRAIRN